jgi:hypothetical protein
MKLIYLLKKAGVVKKGTTRFLIIKKPEEKKLFEMLKYKKRKLEIAFLTLNA